MKARRQSRAWASMWGAVIPGRVTERATDTPLTGDRGQYAAWRKTPDGYGFTADPWQTGQQDGPRMSDPIEAEADEWDDVDWGDE